MRDRMIEDTLHLDADAYERRAEAGAKPKKSGAVIRIVVIAAMLVAGGAIALNAGNKPEAAQPAPQEFAAANPKQIEPQQLTPKGAKPTLERIAKAETPKSPARQAARTLAAKPRPVAAPTPPAAAVSPPPAQTIPEIAPTPSQIAPDAAAPL